MQPRRGSRPWQFHGLPSACSCLGSRCFTRSVSRHSRARTTPLTTRVTPTGFPVTEAVVSQFRKLMLAVLAVFSVQHFTVIPLIQVAETYEAAHSGATHEGGGWQPTEGWERTSFTALTTMLTGIGFAAMLFGV